jgi:hypothetical protein
MKGAVASLLSLGTQNIQLDEGGNGGVGGRKRDLQAFDQRDYGNYELTEQQMRDTPHSGVFACATCLQTLLPSLRGRSKLSQQVHGMAT